MPAERPILLSGPMVRAILAGRKRMTRRLATSPLAKCQPGDRLWVRETWRAPYIYDWFDEKLGRCYRPSDIPPGTMIEYLETGEIELNGKTRPAIFMPRWASRITLEVTGVKIEWLQDITIEDALAEGALEATDIPYVGAMTCDQARVAFLLLWDKLHGKTGPDSWEANPEVVCISFRRIEATHG